METMTHYNSAFKDYDGLACTAQPNLKSKHICSCVAMCTILDRLKGQM